MTNYPNLIEEPGVSEVQETNYVMKKDHAKKKKIVFDDTDHRHAQLKIRLQYDGFSQAEFFRCLVSGYLNKDKNMMAFIKAYKEVHKKQSKRTMGYIEKDDEKAEDILAKFGIKDDELENIFDLIAEEHPEL